MSKELKVTKTIPKIFNSANNPNFKALIRAFVGTDLYLEDQIQNTKNQFFVKTADDRYLDILANNLGVIRPREFRFIDEDFRELIPNLSLKSKVIRKSFYDTADVFWGPLFSRANIQTTNTQLFDIQIGDTLFIQIDNNPIQELVVLAGEIAVPGSATTEEVQMWLSRIKGATISLVEDPASNNPFINIRTNTPGPRGSVEIFENSTIIGTGKLEFPVEKRELRQQNQRVSLYQINDKELIIEVPAILPTLRKLLKGSHHLHTDATLEAPVPPSNTSWIGSFLFDPTGLHQNFNLTKQKATLEQTINPGQILTTLTVDSTANFVNNNGFLVFDYGKITEEQPVAYSNIPNNKTILIDPSYIFTKSHSVGASVNFIIPEMPVTPRVNGDDYAIYLTSPSEASTVVQRILSTLAAYGVTVTFIILAPKYLYLFDNPYLTTDNAPSVD